MLVYEYILVKNKMKSDNVEERYDVFHFQFENVFLSDMNNKVLPWRWTVRPKYWYIWILVFILIL